MPAPAICGSLHCELLLICFKHFLRSFQKRAYFFIWSLFREEVVENSGSGKGSRSCAQRLFSSPSSSSRSKNLLLNTLSGSRGKVGYRNSPACFQPTLWHPFVRKHALWKPGNKVVDVAGLLEPSGGDLRAQDDSLSCSIKSDSLLFRRLPFPLNRGFQSCKPVLDASHDADMEEVLGVAGGGVAAKAELPSGLSLQRRCL